MLSSKEIYKNQKLFFFFFCLLSLTSLPTEDAAAGNTLVQYGIIIVFVAIAFFYGGVRPLLLKSNDYDFIDVIPILFFITWVYGVFVGLLNNVPDKYVFRNFGGMVFYLAFYSFYVMKLNLHSIIKSIFASAYLGIPIILYLTYLAFTEGQIAFGSERVLFCFLQMIIFIPFVVIYGTFFFSVGQNIKYLIFSSKIALVIIMLVTYVVSVIVSFSKGMILASIAIMGLIFVFRMARGLSVKLILKIGGIIAILLGGIIYLGLTSVLIELFSSREVSNATRSLQYEFLIDDLTFLGRGLGAGLTNVNYIRAVDAPYAFELTYLNLMHKFGFMSSILFAIYLFTFVKIFALFGNDENRNFLGLICLGLMAYVFPSIGNPFLLSPIAVICHCLTLYIIKKSKVYDAST